jgi:hypothetical protein
VQRRRSAPIAALGAAADHDLVAAVAWHPP